MVAGPLFGARNEWLKGPKVAGQEIHYFWKNSMALSTNQDLAPTGKMWPHQEVLIGGFMRHKWMGKTVPEGQFIFLTIITYLLLGAKSMTKSVPKRAFYEDKTLLEVLPIGSQSSWMYDKKSPKSSILKDIEGYRRILKDMEGYDDKLNLRLKSLSKAPRNDKKSVLPV